MTIAEKKKECCGCFGCQNICPKNAIKMGFDDEGFRYPIIDSEKCINCKLCEKVCPMKRDDFYNLGQQKAFGGFNKDDAVLELSTSGGAFSAVVDAFCDENYVIFGVTADGTDSRHDYITDKKELSRFMQSKYAQSDVGNSFRKAKEFLESGKKVLFSGTPCQIAGLKSFLAKDFHNLLLIEVVCEGVPSPLYIHKFTKYICEKKKKELAGFSYRYKKKNKWDFQVMKFGFTDGKSATLDRWFNPFWNIWLKHLMSRPSCYSCPFAKKERVADITLGDLWGVHLFAPELYNKNKGASLILLNTKKGQIVFEQAKKSLIVKEISMETALRYQGPLRRPIAANNDRDDFMSDLKSMDYRSLVKKWYDKPSPKLLIRKYIWGNRQNVAFHNLFRKKKVKE